MTPEPFELEPKARPEIWNNIEIFCATFYFFWASILFYIGPLLFNRKLLLSLGIEHGQKVVSATLKLRYFTHGDLEQIGATRPAGTASICVCKYENANSFPTFSLGLNCSSSCSSKFSSGEGNEERRLLVKTFNHEKLNLTINLVKTFLHTWSRSMCVKVGNDNNSLNCVIIRSTPKCGFNWGLEEENKLMQSCYESLQQNIHQEHQEG